jgi:hypothetical protein
MALTVLCMSVSCHLIPYFPIDHYRWDVLFLFYGKVFRYFSS